MQQLNRYRKAIVVVVAGVIALAIAVARGDEPAAIPGLAESVEGLITAFLVWAVPNES